MKKIMRLVVILCMIFMLVTTSVSAASSRYANGVYADEFEKYMTDCGYGPNYEGEDWFTYSELYQYFAEDNDTEVPDWLLVAGRYSGVGPMPCYGVFGDYYIQLMSYCIPYPLIYHIYVPTENKFYTLEQAWTADFENIENAFTEYIIPNGSGSFIGDVDDDGKLTIIDATYVQKALVGLCVFNSYDDLTSYKNATNTATLSYVSDIDRDGNRTIMDATTIQLKLAKVE
ncbi:MAG: dockerin type I repeat-containing protein [Ruminococcus sp.]|nr:dockerin type I repeat-containing protein [Ruminococcus sp.]